MHKKVKSLEQFHLVGHYSQCSGRMLIHSNKDFMTRKLAKNEIVARDIFK